MFQWNIFFRSLNYVPMEHNFFFPSSYYTLYGVGLGNAIPKDMPRANGKIGCADILSDTPVSCTTAKTAKKQKRKMRRF